jgi:hypothetical protein
MDQSKISELAIQAMEELEHAMPEGQVGAVLLIVEATAPDGNSTLVTKASDGRKHLTLGLLEAARLSVIGRG